MELRINNKVINIYGYGSKLKKLPVIILNTFDNEGKDVFLECQKLNCKPFLLVTISNIDWNNELTPWECEPLFKNEEKYGGKASIYLKELESDIIPKVSNYILDNYHKEISYYGICGYSLGGLFSLYALYNSTLFQRYASISGSLWYPNFIEYALEKVFHQNVDKVYLSLGDKESNTKNIILAKVEDNTKCLYDNLKDKINSLYEENPGNHFQDANLRVAKGIKWLVS